MLESTNDDTFIVQPDQSHPARRHTGRHAARDRKQAARARAAELAQQETELVAFNAYVFEGQTFSSIAHGIGCNRQSVAKYVANELDRRSVEFAHRRRTETEKSFAYLTEARQLSAERMRRDDPHGIHLRNLVTATREISALFGLNAATHVVIEQPPPPDPVRELMQRAIAADPAKNGTALLRMAIAARPESERNNHP